MSFIHRQRAFTLVELIATVAIIAILAVVLVVFVGDYLAQARQTADRQTLAVLNDALNRFKTQGGRLAALTSGASIGNVLNLLQTPVDWAGTTHQFLKTGTTYHAASLGAIGEGARFRFSKYGSYADGSVIGSDILSTVAAAGYDVGDEGEFDEWITNAMQETGSSNYLALTNPDTTQLFQIDVRVANSGDKVRVWWGDGTTQDFDSIATGSNTAIYKDFGSVAERTIVIVGDIDYLYTDYDDGRTAFGGTVEGMRTLEYLYLEGTNTVSTSFQKLPDSLQTVFLAGNSDFAGNIADLPRSLSFLSIGGSSSILGDIADLPPNITHWGGWAYNSLSGDISSLPTGMSSFVCWDGNTISGDLSLIPEIPPYLLIKSNSTLTYPETSGQVTWPSSMQRVYLYTSTFTSAMVDSILIDLANQTNSWSSTMDVVLLGGAGPRTSASDAAVATLEGLGVTVSTN